MFLKVNPLKQLILSYFLISSIQLSGQVQLGNDILGSGSNNGYGRTIVFSDDGTRVASSGRGTSSSGNVNIHEYQSSTSTWIKIGSDIDGGRPGEQLGFSIDLSGDGKRLVTLSPSYSQNGNRVGLVKVFEESNGSWIQLGNDIIGQNEQYHFSVSMSKDGKRIAVGTDNDRVKVFEETPLGWRQVGGNINGNGRFGFSVSLSRNGKRLIVGAPSNSTGGISGGQVKIFEENNNIWTQIGAAINGAVGNQLGQSVALSDDGKKIVIGSPSHSTNTIGAATGTGKVSFFAESGGIWTQVGSSILGDNNQDYFGNIVDISGDGKRILAISKGASYIKTYQENSGVLVQLGNTINSQQGQFVGISGDGYSVGFGATSFSNGIGHVRVFDIGSPPSCIVSKSITNHYCKRRDYLFESIGTVNTGEVVLEIEDQGTLPSGASCTGSPASWTHFNIKTEAFDATGPMTTPLAQVITNNIPVSSLYSLAGSTASFYHLPTTAIAILPQYTSRNRVYRIRVTLTGVRGTVTSSHSTEHVLSVSPNVTYQCTTPSTSNPGLGLGLTPNTGNKINDDAAIDNKKGEQQSFQKKK